jgi:hypothetical protein
MTDTLKIEAGKEYLLRNGLSARVYAIDGGGPCPAHGAYNSMAEPNIWTPSWWSLSGVWGVGPGEYPHDIISPAPETIEVDCWLWVYASGTSDALSSKFRGPPDSTGAPAAQIHIKRSITVGEGM